MKVKVHFTQTNEYVAELEYDELAELLAADAVDGDNSTIRLPAPEDLAEKFILDVNADAGPELSDVLDSQGYEVDSYISYVTGFEPLS